MANWGNAFGYTDVEWAAATWGDRFTLINPFFWR